MCNKSYTSIKIKWPKYELRKANDNGKMKTYQLIEEERLEVAVAIDKNQGTTVVNGRANTSN